MATKLGDLTVGADGTWSSGPHTLASGAHSVTLRRKADGAILVTRGFTVAAAGATYTDNFNRATLDGNWTAAPGFSAPTIAGSASAVNGAAYWSANAVGDNQFSTTLIASAGDGYGKYGPRVRQSTSANTYYSLEYDSITDGETYWRTEVSCWRCVAGTRTKLGASVVANANESISQDLRLEVSGTTLTCKYRDVTTTTWSSFTRTDSNISSGRVGFFSTDTTAYVTGWEGGDL